MSCAVKMSVLHAGGSVIDMTSASVQEPERIPEVNAQDTVPADLSQTQRAIVRIGEILKLIFFFS